MGRWSYCIISHSIRINELDNVKHRMGRKLERLQKINGWYEMVDEIYSQIRELRDKATKYDNMRGRYQEIAAKINKGIGTLKEAMEMMDPVITMPHQATGPKPGYSTKIMEDAYKRMELGMEVTMEILQREFPNIPLGTLRAVFSSKLRHMPHVEQRFDGKKSILYINKNIG